MNKKIIITVSVILILSAIAFGIFTYTENSNAKAKKIQNEKLTAAIATGNLEQVKDLVSDKHTSLAANKDGVTPLDLAIMNQDYKIASVLLEHGADVSPHSDNPLFVTLVFSVGNPNDKEAIQEAYDMFLTAIKKHKDKLTNKNSMGNTALHIAALRGLSPITELLMKEGLDPSEPNAAGETPVYIASQEGHIEIITQLKEKDPELLKTKDSKGNTIITAAVINMRDELLNFLIKEVPDLINEPNHDGKTALMYASEYGGTEMVQSLLNAGADPSIKDKENKTAVLLAKEWKHKEIIKLLNKKTR